MGDRCAVVMFVDACGWEVIRSRPWFLDRLPYRQKAASLFGFSSACVPAILSGRRPDENDHWSSFYYSPATSPFKALKLLRALPASLFDRGRVRRYLSKAIAVAYGFTGYFQIYNLPFEVLPLFDYAEKKDIFKPGGINRGPSIFDHLVATGVPYHVSNWHNSEEANVAALRSAVKAGEPRFAFLYSANLDGLMHEVTKASPAVDDKLRWYEAQIDSLLADARQRYGEVRFALISDHGMATIHRVVDLMPRIEALGLAFGVDYAAVYDSTMIRFWYFRDGAEARIREALPGDADGRWVERPELEAYGTFWPDHRFGQGIYALDPGVLLNPSHMGRVAPAGMHGYRPEHPDSDATLLASFTPSTPIRSIVDFHGLMREMAEWAMA
ncbi:MAG: alkaline phosphatase family protein [Holophagales bacterium]|nr:MAG: alkaline phosphatase family protein [Holophagales bacterium]